MLVIKSPQSGIHAMLQVSPGLSCDKTLLQWLSNNFNRLQTQSRFISSFHPIDINVMDNSSSVDLLGLNTLETKAQNESSIVTVVNPKSSNQWEISLFEENTDILLQFNQQPVTNSDNVRTTRKERQISSPILQPGRRPSNLLVGSSILDDRSFAPPPLPSRNKVIFEFMAEREANHSDLPCYTKVMHSGKVLSRISIKSLITKNWKEVFWIIYGVHQLIFFRSIGDYEEWLLNPYLSEKERIALIKLKIDFVNDLSVTGLRGYKCTKARQKFYRRHGKL